MGFGKRPHWPATRPGGWNCPCCRKTSKKKSRRIERRTRKQNKEDE